MQEMRVQALDARQQFGGEHQRLAEAAHPVGRGIAPQVSQPELASFLVLFGFANLHPTTENPQRLQQQVFRQVEQRRLYFGVHRVAARVGGLAQRNDGDVQAAALERGDLLGDEALRQPRIALQDESDPQLQRIRVILETARTSASATAGSIQGATSRETLRSPSSSPGTTTSEGRLWRGSARSAAAITAGS